VVFIKEERKKSLCIDPNRKKKELRRHRELEVLINKSCQTLQSHYSLTKFEGPAYLFFHSIIRTQQQRTNTFVSMIHKYFVVSCQGFVCVQVHGHFSSSSPSKRENTHCIFPPQIRKFCAHIYLKQGFILYAFFFVQVHCQAIRSSGETHLLTTSRFSSTRGKLLNTMRPEAGGGTAI
jgi:hypothetical protein